MTTSAPLLAVEGLQKSFGGVRAADGLSLEVAEGALLCLIGPNGCGKTTLFNLVSGELRPDAGSIRFAGQEIVGLRPHQIARLGIVRKFQVPGVYPDLSVAENLAVPLAAERAARGASGLLQFADEAERRGELLALAGLEDEAGIAAGALAHGRKQWLEIAMVLAARPRLMLLDEPTAGMTPAETRATADLVRRVQRETGAAVIVIEHDLAFVRELDCEIAVMMRGAIICRGSYDEVRADPTVRDVYLGRAA